ncbi:hypothetical protein B7494_g6022 [Chlorociboria aeruginascens]|nr:hypothetical protein B7494_g6022 [Chlorociboria aeruginascens]
MGLELFRTGIRILTRGCIPTPLPLSDDDPSMLEDSALDECAVEFYVASKEPYRKAARGKIPMPWPYESRRVDDHARNIIEDKYGDYFDVLEYFGISAKHITTENLTCSETNQSRDTIIITTTDENTERWQEAATIIEQHSYDPWRPESDNLVVEIRNADKMYTEYASSLPRSSRSGGNGELVMAARAIGRFLPDYLDRVAPGAWYFAEICWSQLDGQSRDLKPIIWVLFLPGTRALWSKLEQELKEAIEAITMPDLVVEFRLEFGVSLHRSLS